MADDSNGVGDCGTIKPDEIEEGYVVRARGLPWSASEEDVRKFFDNSPNIVQIAFTYNREGRPTGEVYIEFANQASLDTALKKDREKIGHRYIEIFHTKKAEMFYVLKVRGKPSAGGGAEGSDSVVRMRGLPFGCTKEEITNFFAGLAIAPNGITLPMDYQGRPSGEAFVEFVDKNSTEKALEKHMQNISHRYIEVFRSSYDEVENVQRRINSGSGFGNNRGRGGGGDFRDYDRGDPWGYGGGRPSPYDRPSVDRYERYGGRGGGWGDGFDRDQRWGGAAGGRNFDRYDSWGKERSYHNADILSHFFEFSAWHYLVHWYHNF